MKLASTLLASLILCYCTPLRYQFTEGTTVHHKTDAERRNHQASTATNISR